MPLPREIDRLIKRRRERREFRAHHSPTARALHGLSPSRRRSSPDATRHPGCGRIRLEDDGPTARLRGRARRRILGEDGQEWEAGLGLEAVGLEASSAPESGWPPRLLRSLVLVSKARGRERRLFFCLFVCLFGSPSPSNGASYAGLTPTRSSNPLGRVVFAGAGPADPGPGPGGPARPGIPDAFFY